MENKEYNIAKGHIAELIVNEILRPKKGKVDKKYYVELTTQLHTLELDDGEEDCDKLTHKEKLKLYKFIHKKFWTMNMKELHEMEEEYGEDGLIDCFNELMRPLTKHING